MTTKLQVKPFNSNLHFYNGVPTFKIPIRRVTSENKILNVTASRNGLKIVEKGKVSYMLF